MSATIRATVKRALPHRWRIGPSRWQAGEEIDNATLELALNHLETLEKAGASAGADVLKRTERKLVFGFEGTSARQWVMKVTWLHTLKRLLARSRYEQSEASNAITARERGLNVVDVKAVGFRYSGWGIPRRSMMIVPRLVGYRSALSRLTDGAAPAEVLDAVVPIFESLYRLACHHLDCNANNVMVSDDKAQPPVLLDLQFMAFGARPSAEMLMFQAGRFAMNSGNVDRNTLKEWIDRLIDRCGLSGEAERCRRWFAHYAATDLSRAERLAMVRRVESAGG